MEVFRFNISPCPAPRMTQRDRFAPSKAASRYFAFCNEMRFMAYNKGLREIPEEISSITFSVPMPPSWSLKKRGEMNGKGHTQKPDIDNLLKATLDALCKNDAHICSIGKIKKKWSDTGSIEIVINETG